MKTDPCERICAYCEHARISPSEDGEDEVFYCQKKKKEMPGDGTCRGFAYDLLKRKIQPRPSLPSLADLDPE